MIWRNKSQGFTLFELIIVIAIIGILATMAAPSFTRLSAQKRTQQGAMDIIYAFNQARSQAALSGKNITFTIGNSNKSYTVTSGSTTIANFSLNNQLSVRSNAGVAVTINPSGKTSAGTQYFRICDGRVSGIAGYSVWIYPSGLSRYIKGKSDVDNITNTDC